jgi:hypothetical protein
MDPSNLTYPIVFNASINATLNPTPPNLIKDWLPSIISIVVVIIGGLITYFVAIRIEEQKHQYELKKEVYFGVLDAIYEVNRLRIELYRSIHRDARKDSNLSSIEETTKMLLELTLLLKLHQSKMQICANEEINRIFDDVIVKAPNIRDDGTYIEFDNAVRNKLIPAMNDDLMKSRKNWLRSWK